MKAKKRLSEDWINSTARSSREILKLFDSNKLVLQRKSDSMPEALQKHGPSSNSIASSLKTSSKLPKLQMEIEPGPLMSQPEVLPADVCREARPTPIKGFSMSRSLIWHVHSCLIPTGSAKGQWQCPSTYFIVSDVCQLSEKWGGCH